MIEKEVTKVIYIADDGKEFFSKHECERYDKFVKETLSKIKYFCVLCDPDLNDKGIFTNKIYVAVLAEFFHKEVVFEWALRKFEHYLGVGVQGFRFHPIFDVCESNKNEYEECETYDWDDTKFKSNQIFLSYKPVYGFPENIDYMKEWGFKYL